MIKKTVIVLLILFTVVSFCLAEDPPESASYILLKGHFAAAGGISSSTTYNTLSSLGQIVAIGKSGSTSYNLYSGIFTPLFSSYNIAPEITYLTANPSQDFTASVFPYTVTFTATVVDGDSSVFDYNWDFGDGATDTQLTQGNIVTITHAYTATKEDGPYVITCTVSDGTATAEKTVNVYLGPQAPDVEIQANPSYGAPPLNVELNAIAMDPDSGTIVNYEWNFGDGSAAQSGASLLTVNHTYSETLTATTVYTVTVNVTDNEGRVGTDTQDITLYPALFFDDFEDGDASDWIQYDPTDWAVESEDTYMLATPMESSGRHIKAPIPGGVIDYGTIRVDMKFVSSSTTTYKTGMVMWAFDSISNFRYLKVDYDNQRIIFGKRESLDQDLQIFSASGWSIPIDTVFSVTVVIRPDASVVAYLNNTEIGSYAYGYEIIGGVGLATRKSKTFFDNFMLAHVSDSNSPPEVSITPSIFVSTVFPATVNYTASATDPDGDDNNLYYYWDFGDGDTQAVKNPTHEYLYEGVYKAQLYVTDEPEYGGDPATTVEASYAHVGVDYYDNFNDNDISDWEIVALSDFTVTNGRIVSGTNETNNIAFAPYTLSADFNHGKACMVFNIQETASTKMNAMLIFGWQDTNSEYRFVRYDRDDSAIKIMHDDESTTEITDASTSYDIPLGQDIHTCVKVAEQGTGDRVTVTVEGMQVLAYTYSTQFPGKWGIRSGKSTTQFDEFIIFDDSTLNSLAANIDTNITEYDFGEVSTSEPLGSTVTITIYNTAPVSNGENLVISNFMIGNSDYTVEDTLGNPITTLASPIVPGGSVNIVVRYIPTAIGTDDSSLIITSNDPDETTYAIILNGEGVISQKPTATVTINPSSQTGPAPLYVTFSATATDPDGDDALIQYLWNFGDASPTTTTASTSHTYDSTGTYTATLTLTDESTQTNSYEYEILVEKHYFLDTFNDSDVSNWTLRQASNWGFYNDSGDIKLTDNNLTISNPIDYAIVPADANFTDFVTAEFDVMMPANGGNNIIFIFDYVDDSNYGYLEFQVSRDKWKLNRVDNGTVTLLDTGDISLYYSVWHHFAIDFDSGIISVSMDGNHQFSSTYASFIGSKNGIGVNYGSIRIDNYKITFNDFGVSNEAPTVSITATPTSGQAPLTVTFDSTADDPDGNNSFITYNWDFGNSSGTSSAADPTYTYTAAGTYTATCRVTDSGTPAATATDTIVITVAAGNSAPTLTLSADQTMGSTPLTVNFTAVGNDINGDGLTYEWNFGDGSSTTATQNPTHTYTADGTYVATCTVTDDGSPNLSTTDNLTIYVGNMWIDDFEDANVSDWTFKTASRWTTPSFNSSIRLYGSNLNLSDPWEFAIAPAISEFTDTGDIEYDMYIATSTDGVQYYFVFDYVNANNFAYIRVYYNKAKIKYGRMVAGTETEIATVDVTKNWNWAAWNNFRFEIDSGVVDLYVDGTHIYGPMNFGTITSGKHGIGLYYAQAYIDNYQVTFLGSAPSNQSPTLNITASPTAGNATLTVNFTSTADDPDGENSAITYAWNFGDSGTSTAANPTHSYTSTGTYTATCVITDSGTPALTAQDTLLVTVTEGNQAPTLNVSASPTSGQPTLTVSFTANASDPELGTMTYEWNFGDGSATSATQNPTHMYTATGTFTATCTVTDDGSPALTDTDTVEIVVSNTSFFLDDFEDGNITNWAFTNTANWSTASLGGSIRMRGANMNISSPWDIARAPAAADFTDTATIEVDAYLASSAYGVQLYIIFDYVDKNNFGYVRILFNKTRWEVGRYVSGTATTILQGTSATITYAVWHHYTLDFDSGVLDLSIDGTPMVSGVNYGTFLNGKNGVAVNYGTVYWDNYKVTFTGAVSSNQAPTVSISSDVTTGLIPLTVQFTATGNDPEATTLSYAWNFGDGTGTSSDQNPTYTYANEGTFTATCTVYDSGSPVMSGTDTLVITPDASNHAPTLTASANPINGQPTLTVTFTAVAYDQDLDTLSYEWDFGDSSATSTTQNPTHAYTATGTYTATCTVTDNGSPVMSATDTVVINVSDSIFEDDFNDANITDWTQTISGSYSTYTIATGNYGLYGLYSNVATIMAPVSGTFEEGNQATFDFMIRSGQAYTKMKLGFAFDVVDWNNYGMVYIDGESSRLYLVRYVNGSLSYLVTVNLGFSYNTWYEMNVAISPSGAVSVYIDGILRINAYAYGSITSNYFGFWTAKSAVVFDNIVIDYL
ncbi:MAG: PKD domain-containing protein [Acidobacteria bacterium]|nr:PKD domain-containing protein [Acidobacteriota bacterium]